MTCVIELMSVAFDEKEKIFLEVVINGIWWAEKCVGERSPLLQTGNLGQGWNRSSLCLLQWKNCHVQVNDLMSLDAHKLHASLTSWMEKPSAIMENIEDGGKIRSLCCRFSGLYVELIHDGILSSQLCQAERWLITPGIICRCCVSNRQKRTAIKRNISCSSWVIELIGMCGLQK